MEHTSHKPSQWSMFPIPEDWTKQQMSGDKGGWKPHSQAPLFLAAAL